MAAHESPRTTKLYDRTGDEITLDEVERIRNLISAGLVHSRLQVESGHWAKLPATAASRPFGSLDVDRPFPESRHSLNFL